MAEPFDAHERRELCDLVEELGPDAPTLCEGWKTLDLAAHLVLREHFQRWGDKKMASEKSKGLAALLARLRAGAPLLPWQVPGVRTLLNGMEYFIHHEDVRRANGHAPRTDFPPDIESLMWKMTGLSGRQLAHKIRPYSMKLERPDGAPRTFGSGPSVIISGAPTELVLFLSGRRAAANVTISGDDDAVATLERSHLGL